MSKILEMRENRKKAWEAAKAFVETKRDKDGLLSEEDAKTYAEMEKKVQAYAAEIERMEQMDAMEAEMNRPVNTPIVTKPKRKAVQRMSIRRPCWMHFVPASSV